MGVITKGDESMVASLFNFSPTWITNSESAQGRQGNGISKRSAISIAAIASGAISIQLAYNEYSRGNYMSACSYASCGLGGIFTGLAMSVLKCSKTKDPVANKHVSNDTGNEPPSNKSRTLREQLLEDTKALHAQAHKVYINHRLMKGEFSLKEYHDYLIKHRSLHQSLDQAIDCIDEKHYIHSFFKDWIPPVLHRREALQEDIAAFEKFDATPPSSKVEQEYAEHLKKLAKDDPICLLPHLYVRYGAELSGNQMMIRPIKKRLEVLLGTAEASDKVTHYFDYSQAIEVLGDLKQYKQSVWLKNMEGFTYTEDLGEEAQRAFQSTILILQEIKASHV